ncbi:nucleoside triphosphate pyrophosphohydrolase MazG [Legionella beliardensis]|uniref:Nucleoside triphosphate pyrophosphohydrolase MazG n=1 Tax=Legionella beliardensis TaxID=91822 RepID=A0A378I129_9GAMM|nr:MazG nucleotide pyrophosphohydrolase domain-containing protein [Legionella beliardensis]STX28375.1 nucleoside triphosphate pyrophosphohydrolase MazG [Legionella beliardensis]
MNLLEKVLLLEQEAAQFGFRWDNAHQIMAQIKSECLEVSEHLPKLSDTSPSADLQEEIGDLLHAVFSLCVFCQFNPKDTLNLTLTKFERRLNAVKQIAGMRGLTNLEGHSFSELMEIWEQAKKIADS